MLLLSLTGTLILINLIALLAYPIYKLTRKKQKTFTISLMIDLNGHIDNKVKIEHD